MTPDPQRRALLASLGAWSVLGCLVRASPSKAAAPPDEDRPVVQGAIGVRLHDYLSRAAAFGFSGTVLVAVDDSIVLHRGYGFADLARGEPNRTETLYDIGSIVKTLTAGAILLLESEGRLSIADPIARFFADVPPDKREIRLERLLTHMSGIIDPPLGDYEPIGRDALVKLVLESPLGGRPGTTYIYSNAGFSMLAAIIETVTGTPYEWFMRERLLLPAGMTATGYTLPWDPALVAHTYTYPVDHGSPLDRLRAAKGPGWILMGNGGMIGTAGDLYRWDRFFRSGRVIPAARAAAATEPHVRRGPRSARGYDWEIEVGGSGERSWGHASDAPYVGLNGWLGHYPAQKTTIVLLANNRLNGASSRHFVVPNIRRILRGEAVPLPPRVRPVAAANLRRCEGVFTDGAGTIAVRASRHWLELGADGQQAVDLLNARQGEAAVIEARALNEQAEFFAEALQGRDMAASAAFLGDRVEADGFAAAWRKALEAHGPLQRAEMLGTFRLDRKACLTTMRLGFAKGAIVVRFGWQDGKIASSSEDLMLASLAGPLRISPVPYAAWQPFWYPGNGALFTFDLLTGTIVRTKTESREGEIVELIFERPGAEASRWHRSEPRSQSR